MPKPDEDLPQPSKQDIKVIDQIATIVLGPVIKQLARIADNLNTIANVLEKWEEEGHPSCRRED